MAAGLTDHVWTFRELLTAKFEPLESQSISQSTFTSLHLASKMQF